ncbi:MAG: hypothetical protein FWH29_11110 [Methanobrevibacter sp.]|nr:hypothetical protein [Methanobrevibacter sp.]
MKLNDTINITQNITNIENLLLDFEQFPQTSLLYGVLSELFLLSQKLRKYFQLKNINGLINELIIGISAAIEREIVLEVKDIDLFLRVMDLILYACNMNYDNIYKISTTTNEISNSYMIFIKGITKRISLLKKTKYIKNELLKEYNSNKLSYNMENSKKDDEKVLNTTNKYFSEERQIDKKNQLTDLSEILSLYNNTINIVNNNGILLTDKEKNNILNIASFLEDNSGNKVIEELQSSVKQIDWIDNYLTKLDKISKLPVDVTSNNKNELTQNITIGVNEIENIIKNTITLNNTNNYNEYFRIIIKKITQSIINLDDTLINLNQIKDVNTHLLEIKSLFEELQLKMNDNLLNASVYTNSIYNQLSKIICNPFNSIVLGLNEYAEIVGETVNKNVKLQITGSDINIPIYFCQILNNALPMIIRYIILTNFAYNFDNFIKIELTFQNGIIELKIMDNGKKSDIKFTQKMLKDVFIMCKSAGGRIFLRSGRGANETKIKFQFENILENYVVLENNSQYYGVPVMYCVAVDDDKLKEINSVSLNSLFNNKQSSGGEVDFIVINYLDNYIKILVDRVVGIMMLSPNTLKNNLFDSKYITGLSNFINKPVFLLDINAIIDAN